MNIFSVRLIRHEAQAFNLDTHTVYQDNTDHNPQYTVTVFVKPEPVKISCIEDWHKLANQLRKDTAQ